MDKFPGKLKEKLRERKASGSLRALREQDGLVDFSSNDYLGYARHKGIASWTAQLLSESETLLNGATGSRLLTGNHKLYSELEKILEKLHEAPVLVFNSGYDANIGFFASVPQRHDLVFYDELAHASIRDGIRLGLAKSFKFRHNDLEDLREQLKKIRTSKPSQEVSGRECYVVTESVFSMDGDSPDLEALCKLCAGHGCRLVVDEAHAIGVFGPGCIGLMQAKGLQEQVFARILTFGKAMGAHGAAIAGNGLLKEYLLNFARSFIYTTALPPHSIAGLQAACHFSSTDSAGALFEKLRENIDFFRQGLASQGLTKYFHPSESAIHSCIIPGNSRVGEVAGAMRDAGFDLRPILAPTVPEGKERLRFCLHSFNTREEIEAVQHLLSDLIKVT